MSVNRITLSLDLNTLGFGAGIELPYSLKDLLGALPGDAADMLGWMPDITLEEVKFAFDPTLETFALQARAGIAGSAHPSANVFLYEQPVGQKPNKSYALVVGLALDTPIDLSGTPLFGPLLEGITVDAFGLTYASEDVPDSLQATYTKGFALTLTLRAGDSQEVFNLTPATRKSSGLRLTGPDGATDEPPTVQWFPVQKAFGPLAIDRIGIATPPGRFGLALDASVKLAGLSLALSGFTATFPKADVSLAGLVIGMDGIAVSFSSGTVRIAGSLLKIPDSDPLEYAGGLMIQAGKFGITALGAFAQVEGAISLFVFGLALGPFGGPPAFFVTGIAAGFGYNRSLKLPAPDRVQEYPLIQAAKDTNYLPTPPSPAAALSKMSAGGFVPPRTGSYWVAAGVRFSSFQVLDSFAVVSIEFGQDLVVALLGISALRLPKIGPAYAYAELTLSAVLRPLEGTFKMGAYLTPNSFVIDRNCRLQGGFAFWVWFGDHEYSGDFVVSLGGYNPHYTPPSWYPQVPRLGFNWDVDPTLRMRGGCYFALTPSCVMAGGTLSISYQSGDLAAWFDAYADFLIWWNPFWFDARIGVNIGARYTLSIAGVSKTFSVELNADVELWGPPLAGKARVNWWVISFTIYINGGVRPAEDKVLEDWKAFATAYLPAGLDQVCRPTAVAGLAQILEPTPPEENEETVWVLNCSGLSLGFETLVPATCWQVLGSPSPLEFQGPESGVYPLGSVKLESTLTWQLIPHGQEEPFDLSHWDWTPQVSNVPQSMWGLENNGQAQMAANVQPALLTGIGVPNPPQLTGPPAVSLEDLSNDPLPARALPLPIMPPIDGGTIPPVVDSRDVIRDTIMAPKVVTARDALVKVLRETGGGEWLRGGDLGLLAQDVWMTFPAAPMLGPLGSTGPRPPQKPMAVVRPKAHPTPTSRAIEERAARHALRAVFYSHSQPIADWRHPLRGWACAYVADSFATEHERRVTRLKGGVKGRAQTRLEQGTTLVWDVPLASRLRLVRRGERPLRVASLDRLGTLCNVQRLDGRDETTIADRARRVIMSTVDSSGAAGWRGTSSLLVVAPQALLAQEAVVRPQSPLRASRRRRQFEHGVVSATTMVLNNIVGGTPGWIETSFMTRVRSAIVVLRRQHDAARLDAISVMIDHNRATARFRQTEADRTFLFYDCDAAVGGEPTRIFLRPSAGWQADGVLGFPLDCDTLDAKGFTPLPPLESTGTCEVEFR